VIQSAKYADDLKALDITTILDLVVEVRGLDDKELDKWEFMKASMDEYMKRTNSIPGHIGAVVTQIKAVRSLVNKLKSEGKTSGQVYVAIHDLFKSD